MRRSSSHDCIRVLAGAAPASALATRKSSATAATGRLRSSRTAHPTQPVVNRSNVAEALASMPACRGRVPSWQTARRPGRRAHESHVAVALVRPGGRGAITLRNALVPQPQCRPQATGRPGFGGGAGLPGGSSGVSPASTSMLLAGRSSPGSRCRFGDAPGVSPATRLRLVAFHCDSLMRL